MSHRIHGVNRGEAEDAFRPDTPADNPAAESRSMHRAAFMRTVAAAASVLATGDVLFGPVKAYAARVKAAAPGRLLGNIASLARNHALSYTDPKSGDPAVLIRLANGKVVAYDAVCTHAGCTVPYNPQRRLLICPCHGATYDPTAGARVISGPAPAPLQRLPVRVDAKGNVYALNAKPAPGKPPVGFHQPPPPSAGGDDGGSGDDGGRSTSRTKHRHTGDD
ncbi:MAG TPA: Rieske (2Fe-2S) protein [Chloroflexota bacterium]|nr:Rieske (2Fe-2S) protein [Chloroflexota bacterium]